MRLLLCFLMLSMFSFADEIPMNQAQIMEHVFYHLDTVGYLRQDRSGMVYVEIPDEYIYKLQPLIQEEGFELPTSLQGANALGAHISVIYGGEASEYRIGWVAERGSKVFFKITGCKIVPLNQAGYESACVLTVQAPNLTNLRKKYGLPPMKYDFHITIGMKPAGLGFAKVRDAA